MPIEGRAASVQERVTGMTINEVGSSIKMQSNSELQGESLPRFVRVKKVIKEAFIEFDFAVGDPELYVELILPVAAFEIFCLRNNVIHMSEEQSEAVDRDMKKWRYGKTTKE